MTFAEKLLKLRKEKGMSQEDLAESLEVSRQAVSRWEMGTAMPDSPNLLKISQLFGVSADYLLHDEFCSEKDTPAVKETTSELKKDYNRKKALLVLVGLQALAFFAGLIGHFFAQSALTVWLCLPMHCINIIAFELGFRMYGRPDSGARKYKRLYYQISVWFFAYFPIRIIFGVFWSLYPRPYSSLVREGSYLLIYLLVCSFVTYILKAKKSD